MELIRGVYRMSVALLMLAVGALLMLAVAWAPLRLRGVRLPAWVAHGLARFLLWLYHVRFICTAVDRQTLRQHEGFVFPNHLSFMDALLLMAVWPVRFVSMKELRRWPLVGWIAMAIDTVFVDRADKTSRQEARQRLAQEISHYPPPLCYSRKGASLAAARYYRSVLARLRLSRRGKWLSYPAPSAISRWRWWGGRTNRC